MCYMGLIKKVFGGGQKGFLSPQHQHKLHKYGWKLNMTHTHTHTQLHKTTTNKQT